MNEKIAQLQKFKITTTEWDNYKTVYLFQWFSCNTDTNSHIHC